MSFNRAASLDCTAPLAQATCGVSSRSLVTNAYAKARRFHLVLDNLNTHFRKCFDYVLGKRAATKLLHRVQFHYTPKHASWLNMAEIEIGILSRQCLDRRVASRQLLQSEVDATTRWT
jgi:DDE superfamily endonuclease